MGLFAIICLFWILPLFGAYEGNRILFLISQGSLDQALEHYGSYAKDKGKHDYLLLQQIACLLLDQSLKSKNSEDQLMSMFGAGIAMNDSAFYLLEEGLKSQNPQIQVTALHFLAETQHDCAYDLINKLMSSPYALIRLEAALQLAKNKHPKATAQIEALMQKVDPAAAPLFPPLFALVGDDAALKIMRKLLNHSNHEVRIACMLGAMSNGRDDLLPQIRKLASQHDARQQEAACLVLGQFQDQISEPLLKKLAESPYPSVRIAALKALYLLGIKEAANPLQAFAKRGELFAIDALSLVPASADLLAEIAQLPYINQRLNATLSLLKLKDKRCLTGLVEILINDPRDLAFSEIKTTGYALKAWKAVPSAAHQGEEADILLELSLRFREEVLTLALELPEDQFIMIAEKIFKSKQNDLIPMLVTLLINLDTQEAISLLKTQSQKAGAPLTRAYATLALVKLKEEGPYLNQLKTWILSQKDLDIMKFRTFVPMPLREFTSSYELTPEESSRFLIEAVQVLAESREEDSLDLLLHLLKEGHPRNRPLLAGLILRLTN